MLLNSLQKFIVHGSTLWHFSCVNNQTVVKWNSTMVNGFPFVLKEKYFCAMHCQQIIYFVYFYFILHVIHTSRCNKNSNSYETHNYIKHLIYKTPVKRQTRPGETGSITIKALSALYPFTFYLHVLSTLSNSEKAFTKRIFYVYIPHSA